MKKSIHPEQPDIYHRQSPASPQVIMQFGRKGMRFRLPGKAKLCGSSPSPHSSTPMGGPNQPSTQHAKPSARPCPALHWADAKRVSQLFFHKKNAQFKK